MMTRSSLNPSAAPGKVRDGKPKLALIALLALMIPIYFQVGSLNLTFSRLVFTPLVPILLFQLLSGRYGRILPTDILVLLYMGWRTLSAFVTSAPVAFEYSASNAAIFLGAYLAARASIRNVADFQYASRILITFVLISFPFAVYEAKTGVMFIPRLLDGIPFIKTPVDANYARRLGMDRVQFVFVHSIHYGLFCSTAFALLYVGLKDRIKTFTRWVGSGFVLLCCLMSVSSGPFLALLCQIPLIAYDYLFRQNPNRWKIFLIAGAIAYAILEVLSDRPAFYAISSRLAFSAYNANYRKVLLEYGLRQIGRTPVFGIGFLRGWDAPAWISGSLDNFWLGDALIFGIPAFAFHFGSVVVGITMIGRRKFTRDSALDHARFAWIFVVVSLMLTLATVYIWSEIASLVFFIYGSGAFLITAVEADQNALPVETGNDRKIRYTRYPAKPDKPLPDPVELAGDGAEDMVAQPPAKPQPASSRYRRRDS
ncbi:MAG: O-antigen ligase family protein [Paracoccaceae bacterium]